MDTLEIIIVLMIFASVAMGIYATGVVLYFGAKNILRKFRIRG